MKFGKHLKKPYHGTTKQNKKNISVFSSLPLTHTQTHTNTHTHTQHVSATPRARSRSCATRSEVSALVGGRCRGAAATVASRGTTASPCVGPVSATGRRSCATPTPEPVWTVGNTPLETTVKGAEGTRPRNFSISNQNVFV